MPKTTALLLIALSTSVMAIAFAYVVGQRSAEHRAGADAALSRAEREAIVAELRRDLLGAAAPTVETPLDAAGGSDDAGFTVTSDSEPVARAEESDTADATASEGEVAVSAPIAPVDHAETDTSSTPDAALAPPPLEEAPATPIARESFDAVALGTPYAEVAQKFGREGRAALTLDDASGAQTKQYNWQWTGPLGEACRVDMLFVDGRLTEKVFRE